jgi:hypothetical protein
LASKKQSDFFHAIFTIIGVFRDFKREMDMDGLPSRPFFGAPGGPGLPTHFALACDGSLASVNQSVLTRLRPVTFLTL